MPPRPSLQSLLLMAVAAGDSAPPPRRGGGGGRGHRIRMLHSSFGSRLPRRPEVACCVRSAPVAVRSRNVHSAEVYKKDCEARLGQLIEKLKKEGINPKQWRLGTFQRMLCPMPDGASKVSQAKNNTESEIDKVVEANQAVNKVYRKLCEEDLNLHPLCDKVLMFLGPQALREVIEDAELYPIRGLFTL